MKELLYVKPKTLTDTAEHRIIKRKWWAVILLIVGGIILAGKLPLPLYIPYVLFLFGHAGMLHSFILKHDIPMTIVNGVWMIIDMIGIYRWYN